MADRWAGKFDCITAFDVIEHVATPEAFFQRASELLKPGGRLFLSTPDQSSVVARAFGRWWHYYHRFHLSMFGPATLRRLAAKHGFEWLAIRRIGRLRSVEFLGRYFFEYALRRDAPAWVSRLRGVDLPINLFDTMSVVLAKAKRVP